MACDLEQDYIYIYKGDDTNWNNEQFVTFNVSPATGAQIDLADMTAEFILGSYTKKNISLATGTFDIDLNAATSGSFAYGPIYGSIKIYDTDKRVKTVANKIPFYITDNVIAAQNQTRTIEVPQGSEVTIDLTVGGSVSYNNLTDLPTLNGVTIQGNGTYATYNLPTKAEVQANTQAISAEVQNRQNADTVLQGNLNAHIANKNNPHDVTKAQIGLGNVDNTADADKPISNATQSALNAKQNTLTTAQLSAVNSGVTTSTVAQVATNLSYLTSFAPYIQKYEIGNFLTQETVNANDLLAATGGLHALDLDLSANTQLKKLTAKGIAGNLANLYSVLVSNEALFDSATSPQLDVSYTGLNRSALVNLFNSMPYNVGYTVVGSPTITDWVASGLSDSNYLPLSSTFSEEGDIDIVIKFTTDELTAQQYPFSWSCKPANTNRSCGLYINSGGKYGFVVRDTADHNYQYTVSATYTLSANTTYYLRLLFTAADKSLKMGASTDNVNYTYGISITLTADLCPMNGTGISIGRARANGYPFLGSIDLNNTYINIGGIPWFRGTAAMTKTCSVVGCAGTAYLTADDKAIATGKGWELVVA